MDRSGTLAGQKMERGAPVVLRADESSIIGFAYLYQSDARNRPSLPRPAAELSISTTAPPPFLLTSHIAFSFAGSEDSTALPSTQSTFAPPNLVPEQDLFRPSIRLCQFATMTGATFFDSPSSDSICNVFRFLSDRPHAKCWFGCVNFNSSRCMWDMYLGKGLSSEL